MITERGWVVWMNQIGGEDAMRLWFHHHRRLPWKDVWHRLNNPNWMLRVLERAGRRDDTAMLLLVGDIAKHVEPLVPEGWRALASRARLMARRKAHGVPVAESALEEAFRPFLDLRMDPAAPSNVWAARCSMLAVQLAHTQTLGVASIDWSDLGHAIEEGCVAVRYAETLTRDEWHAKVSVMIRNRIPKPPRIP